MKKMAIYSSLFAVAISTMLMAPVLFAQQGSGDQGGDGVLMLEEIRIQVAPELPTVVVTIPRQRPEITSVTLKKAPEDLIYGDVAAAKPRLADLQISQIKEPSKMLAKERGQ